MDRFLLDGDLSSESELEAFLEYNGVSFVREPGGFRFLLTEGGCGWETVCRFTRRSVIIYGLYPFELTDGILPTLNAINAKLIRGCMLLNEGGVSVRTSADLYDAYGSYEAIARALEYNAGVIVKYWSEISAFE